MLRTIALAIAAAAVSLALAGTADAKTCRDATGHFIKCEAPAAGQKCRDAAGHFIACKAAAAAPTPAAAHTSGAGMLDALRRKAAPQPAATTTTTTAAKTTMSASGGHPQCKTGKPCGDSCIATNKVCHK